MKTIKCTVHKAKPSAVMGQVDLSDLIAAGSSVRLQLVDINGNPYSITDPTTVATTLTASDLGETVTPGADTLHYSLSFTPALASGGSVVTDSATLTFNDGSFGPFTASLPILCNVSPPPPAPVDLQLLIG